MPNLSLALAENLLSEVIIPPKPEILVTIQEELKKENPNLKIVADNITEDSGLFSSILRLINSPYFGMRCEINSIEHAISLLGIDSLVTNIACIKFRTEMNSFGYVAMPTYWNRSLNNAKLCSYLANELGVVKVNESYAVGLLKDAGIPILARKYDDYKNILKQQNENNFKIHTELEDKFYNTNHCVVGFLMTKKWGMNKQLRNACLFHHDINYIISENSDIDLESRKLILVSKIAEYIINSKNNINDFEWPKIRDYALLYFGLNEDNFNNLSNKMFEQLENL